MSWFRSKHNTNDKGRKRHVQSLMSKNGRLYTVTQKDRNAYIISFKTRMGENNITVMLSDSFPDTPPRLYCNPKYSHPLLDNNGNIIGIDELNKWTNYSDLGRIVQSSVMQFTASPPTLKAVVPVQPPTYQQHINVNPPSYQQHNSNTGVNIKKQQSVLDMRSIKLSIPKIIPQIEELNNNQINDIIKEDKLIEDLAYAASSTLREMRKQQQSEILRIAKLNLTKKDDINKKDKEIKLLRQEIDTLTTYFANLKIRQDKVLQKYSKKRINIELNKEIEKYDNQCNQLKDKFDEQDIVPIAFVKKYVKTRTKYHQLQIKKEKFNLF